MKIQVVASKNPVTPQYTPEELVGKRGFLVSVYQNGVSFMLQSVINGSRAGTALVNPGFRQTMSTFTEGNVSEFLKRIAKVDYVEFHYYETLHDFAQDVIKFGWKLGTY
jgi:hypothetical protein